MSSPQVLADTLTGVSTPEYARFVAHWMTQATDLGSAPAMTGGDVVDALVAAASAQVAFTGGAEVPDWTEEDGRSRPGSVVE